MKTIHVLSLGAGVQSSTLALLYARGELSPMPVAAVFADTHGEPQEVYDYLAYIESLVPFPVLRVSAGDLAQDFLDTLAGKRKRCSQPPFYVKNPDRALDAGGMIWRQCTHGYKLTPIAKAVSALKKQHAAKHVAQIIGISWDEMTRMKTSGRKSVTNIFPLVEMKWRREKCLSWMKENGYKQPPKSACWFCPYMKNSRWADLKKNDPVSFAKAVAFDNALRAVPVEKLTGAKINGKLFVHRSFKPLSEVHFGSDEENGQSVFSLLSMQDECDGVCGV